MPINKLLIAAVILAALSGLVFWSERSKKAEESQPAKDAPPKLITVAFDQIDKVEIKKKGDDTVLQKTGPDKWTMVQPNNWPVDQEGVGSLLSAFEGVSWDRIVEDKASDLGQYGLSDPALQFTVNGKGGKQQTLLIGDDTPTGGDVYAKLANDPRVFTLPTGTKSSLDKTALDMRDKRMLVFDNTKVARIEVMGNKQPYEIGKNSNNQWQLIKPKPFRADNFQVEELIRKLKDLKMDASEDQKQAVSAFAGGKPVATVKVTDESGTHDLVVRKNKDDYYAKSQVLEGAHKIPADMGAALAKPADDLRNKKLFEFGFTNVGKVEIHDGAKTYVFQRSGDKWFSNGKQMDTMGVQSVIDKQRDLTATGFSEKPLGAPSIDITVTDADMKKSEHVQIAKTGDGYFAQRVGEPTVYTLAPESVSDIQRAAADVKPAETAKK